MLKLKGLVLGVVLAALGFSLQAQARPKPAKTNAVPVSVATHKGRAVEVLWDGKWWNASVIGTRPGFKKVHYTGWSTNYDEWVENKNIRAVGTTAGKATVEILWGGKWWKGKELARKSGLIKVHYVGWGTKWDQWVEPERIRKLR